MRRGSGHNMKRVTMQAELGLPAPEKETGDE